ncbi:MAG: acetolactate synthase small subunit [Lachnospiraceae bacterium]|nr:acetolactate synthase small subunit [Lachnospiraceae bacterium]
MKKIFSVSVENRFGVLNKVSSLFARRGYNIESLTVGETHDPTISNMTIVSSGSAHDLEQIEKQLNKKLDVIKVRTFNEEESVSRELILIKLKYAAANRGEIIEICQITKAEIVDTTDTNMIIQLCDTPDRVDKFIDMIRKFNIVELSRTGTLAMKKCK